MVCPQTQQYLQTLPDVEFDVTELWDRRIMCISETFPKQMCCCARIKNQRLYSSSAVAQPSPSNHQSIPPLPQGSCDKGTITTSEEQSRSGHITKRLVQRFMSSQLRAVQLPRLSGRVCRAEQPHRSSSVRSSRSPMLSGRASRLLQPERLITRKRDIEPTESGSSCMRRQKCQQGCDFLYCQSRKSQFPARCTSHGLDFEDSDTLPMSNKLLFSNQAGTIAWQGKECLPVEVSSQSGQGELTSCID